METFMKRRKPYIIVKCLDCDDTRELVPWMAKKFIRCKACAEKEKYNILSKEDKIKLKQNLAKGQKKYFENVDKNTLSERGKKARASVSIENIKKGRIRQQQTIMNDPEKYANYCKKRKEIALNFHKNLENDEIAKKEHYQKVFGRKTSKAENDFFIFLEDHNILCKRQEMISGFFVDGYIPDKKLVIEFYGDNYHCNPKKFTDPKKYCSWIDRTVEEQWLRDRKRLAVLYKNGCKVLIIWQTDWNRNRDEQLRRIKNAMLEN